MTAFMYTLRRYATGDCGCKQGIPFESAQQTLEELSSSMVAISRAPRIDHSHGAKELRTSFKASASALRVVHCLSLVLGSLPVACFKTSAGEGRPLASGDSRAADMEASVMLS